MGCWRGRMVVIARKDMIYGGGYSFYNIPSHVPGCSAGGHNEGQVCETCVESTSYKV